MKKQIIRISILQSSKIIVTLYVLMGCIYSLIGIPLIIIGNDKVKFIGLFYLLGPVWMGLFGFIFFVIFSAIYNGLAQFLGGFEVEVKDVDSAT